jgi:hypothetical protein
MKKILLIAGLVFSLMSFTLLATGDEVVTALKQGNVTAFSNYFDNVISLTLPDKAEIKNDEKGAATAAIKDFYDKNGVKSFELASQREMGGTMYVAGKLTGGAKSYNITVMMKNKDNKPVIITVRIN